MNFSTKLKLTKIVFVNMSEGFLFILQMAGVRDVPGEVESELPTDVASEMPPMKRQRTEFM